MRVLKALFVTALVIAFAAPVFAETQNVKVSGSLDTYWFYRDDFDMRANNDSGFVPVGTAVPAGGGAAGDVDHRSEADSYFMSITQLQVAADLTDNVSTVINLINQRDWNADPLENNTSGAADNVAQEFDVVLDLAYAQLKEIFYAPLTLTIGRQDLLFGRGFIIGWNPQDVGGTLEADEWTQIQSFDAVRATLDFNPWTIDVVYANITENARDPEDDRDLWINYVSYKFSEYNAVADAYYIAEIDKATNSTLPHIAIADNQTHTVGGRVQFDPISQITLGGELAWQGGDYYSANPNQSHRERDSWGLDIFGEYRFDNPWKPMLGVQYVHFSGEEDLSTNAVSDYNAWNSPFRGPVYGWIHDYKEIYFATGQANDQPGGQNMNHVSVYSTLRPMEDLLLTANYWYIWADKTINTAGIAAAQAATELDEEIGHELDLSAIYSYTEDVTFGFYANWFIAGDLYNAPDDQNISEYISRVTVVF